MVAVEGGDAGNGRLVLGLAGELHSWLAITTTHVGQGKYYQHDDIHVSITIMLGIINMMGGG